MARIKFSIPDQFSFSTTIPVRITDVNYGCHLGNDALLGILHEARLRFLQHHGYSEMNLGGTGLIMADVAIEFKSEAFYGEQLTASVTSSDFTRVGFDLVYKLEKWSNGKASLVALAKTGMVCFDYTSKKITAVPSEIPSTLR